MVAYQTKLILIRLHNVRVARAGDPCRYEGEDERERPPASDTRPELPRFALTPCPDLADRARGLDQPRFFSLQERAQVGVSSHCVDLGPHLREHRGDILDPLVNRSGGLTLRSKRVDRIRPD